jgi:hypothetical protein
MSAFDTAVTVFNFIKTHPDCTIANIADGLRMRPGTIKDAIKRFQDSYIVNKKHMRALGMRGGIVLHFEVKNANSCPQNKKAQEQIHITHHPIMRALYGI